MQTSLLNSSALIILIMMSVYSVAATTGDSEIRSISDLVDSLMDCLDIPGLSLSVVRKDRVIIQRGFGFADVERATRVTKDTLFPIASTSKAFTSTLLAMLLNKTRYDWDTPVEQILGSEFEMYNDELTHSVTLRDLLSHRTGLPGNFIPVLAGYPANMTAQELLRTIKYHKPAAAFRTKFLYNNFMYAVAGYVASVLGKDSWENLTRDYIFTPLGMSSSTFTSTSPYTTHSAFAFPYFIDGSGRKVKVDIENLHQVDIFPSAGAIVSTATDMAKWLQFHLNHGNNNHGKTLVDPSDLTETYKEEMPSPHPMNERDLWRPEFPVSDVHTAYGMAWMTNIYRGYRRVWHSGGITTYKSQVWLYPDLDLGLFISVNGPPSSSTTWGMLLLLQYITDVLSQEQPWVNSSTICTFPSPWRPSSTEPSAPTPLRDDPYPLPVKAYTGLYNHPGFGDIHITQNTSTTSTTRARLHMRMGRFLRALLYYNADKDYYVTKLQGSLAYMENLIPLRFLTSVKGQQVDIVQMPLYSPVSTAEWTNFTRGTASKLAALKQRASSHYCHSSAVQYLSTSPLFILLLLLLAMAAQH